jgi:uncharacterized membrane protein
VVERALRRHYLPLMGDDTTSPRTRVYPRESLEFERVAFFSDAIFAISMTLLVVGLDVPTIADETSSSDLWSALGDAEPKIIIFFVSFAVLGSFWLRHHRYVSRLRSIDRPTTAVILVYLGIIAFLPFPSGILGQYTDNAVAVSFYAVCIAAVAFVSLIMFEVAQRHGLLRHKPTPDAIRWQRILSAVPIVYFLATVPLAFVSATVAIYSWILLAPISTLLQRWMPKDVARYFEE